MLDREAALALINEYKPEPHMMQHALASESVMRALAGHFGEDPESWGLAGLLHDLDYPLTREQPEKHGVMAGEMLRGRLPDEIVDAVMAHSSEYSGIMPKTRMDTALRAAETVTGLVSAAALVRPEGMTGMKVSSLKKKMKDKAFAAAVSRERIRECESIGLPLDEFLALAITAMTPQ